MMFALQTDGKIIVAGNRNSYNYSSSNFVLLRYNPNGSLDTTFSDDGKILTDIIHGVEVAVQSDGKIVVSGHWYNSEKAGFSLVRFNSNGSLDTTFDGDGRVMTYFANNAHAGEIAIQPDGKIVVIGYSYIGPSSYDFALARYNSNGSLDTTFDTDGKLTMDLGSDDTTSGVAIQPDGKIVVVGTRDNGNAGVDNDFVLVRYNSNGSLDTTFDADGKVILRLGFGDIGTDVVLQSNGKILMLGSAAHISPGFNFDYNFALLRFNHDGSLDTTFDTDGIIILDLSPYDPADEIALQPDGKIVLSGGTLNADGDFALVRLKVDDRTMTISGTTGLAGVTLSYTDGKPKTVISQQNGNYSFQVPRGWSGSVRPSKTGYIFSPANRTYSDVLSHQTAQNYTAVPLYSISGNVGVAGATLSYTDGVAKTVTSQSNGNYSLAVPSNWGGTVTPSHPCYTFSPIDKSYTSVGSNLASEDYTPSLDAGTECSDIDVLISGVPQGKFGLPAGASTRAIFTGLNNGPVQIESMNSTSLIAAERVIYKVNGVNTSFTEMMGLPDSQLDTTYWLPWYNNVDLDTQLRIANVSNTTATVNVYIGGTLRTPTPLTLAPGASTRQSFAGVNSGPVQIVSDVNIVVAERVIYKAAGGVNTSFSEMMALPNSQLNTTYWLPWYNNVDLDTQLRIANVTDQPATVTVTIGGVPKAPINLAAGESTRVSYAGVNAGPVKILSTQNIVVAERVIYKVNGKNTSFTEMMALPANQLDTTYWLPWYNSVDLDTQLRFSNTTDQTANVYIYIGGVEMDGSPFMLLAGESARVSFPTVNSGPVQIVSDQNIVAAERVIYKVNGVNTSFSEMMALPNTLMDTTYWLPWYNNVDLDTQLRFGVP